MEKTRTGPSAPTMVALVALAAFGAVALLQLVLSSLLGILKFGLAIVVLVAVAFAIVSAKSRR